MAVKVNKIGTIFLFFIMMLGSAFCHAGGSNSGKDYSNFGHDLQRPIFPKNNTISVYKNKNDTKPLKVFNDMPVYTLEKDDLTCAKTAPADGWVKCDIETVVGWVKRAEFQSAAEYAPPKSWPFRYWLYVAGNGVGEEGVMLYRAVPYSPYLIKPKQFENVFFIVHFDEQGFAISPKTNKKTGDRIFLIGNEVYLAADAPEKRSSGAWLFMGYFNSELQALCPATHKESCYSAVNLAVSWQGIKKLYTLPEKQFVYDSDREYKLKRHWYGQSEIAFARHTDPVTPLMYQVPDDIGMKDNENELSAAQRKKNREKPFCLVDCKGVANQIDINLKPAS